MADKLNILVLHRLGDPRLAPVFLHQHVFSLQNYCPQHNYIYHDTELPLPDFVRDVRFDAILLDVTLLCMRWAGTEAFRQICADYAFVAQSDAVKIAAPQDEYDCNVVLDNWMCDWNVDVVYSVISSHWDVLYPRFHSQGEIRLGFTGYIDDSLIDYPRQPFGSRRIDLGYRARKLAPYFGRIGEVKWRIGELMADKAHAAGLHTDIVLGDSGTLLGEKWLSFINDSKFTLGSNSGSSLLDPTGEIQQKVRHYLTEHPFALFEEVESHCFPGLDGKYAFTAISPRVLEAGLLDSCQVLVEGDYSHLIRPWEHYIPIKSDASDFDRVLEAMKDDDLTTRLRTNCRSALLDCENLRAATGARRLIDLIGDLKSRKRVTSSCQEVDTARRRYQSVMAKRYQRHWRIQSYKKRLHRYPFLRPIARMARSIVGRG